MHWWMCEKLTMSVQSTWPSTLVLISEERGFFSSTNTSSCSRGSKNLARHFFSFFVGATQLLSLEGLFEQTVTKINTKTEPQLHYWLQKQKRMVSSFYALIDTQRTRAYDILTGSTEKPTCRLSSAVRRLGNRKRLFYFYCLIDYVRELLFFQLFPPLKNHCTVRIWQRHIKIIRETVRIKKIASQQNSSLYWLYTILGKKIMKLAHLDNVHLFVCFYLAVNKLITDKTQNIFL